MSISALTIDLVSNKDLERAKKLVVNNIYFGLELSTQIASTLDLVSQYLTQPSTPAETTELVSSDSAKNVT